VNIFFEIISMLGKKCFVNLLISRAGNYQLQKKAFGVFPQKNFPEKKNVLVEKTFEIKIFE